MDFIKRRMVAKAMKTHAERYEATAKRLNCTTAEVACAEYIKSEKHLAKVKFVTEGMSEAEQQRYTQLLHLVTTE